MHKAVENMKKESQTCFIFFMLQLFCFHMSSFLLMWTLYSKPVAMIINIILGVFLFLFIYNGKDIYDKLALDESETVSGKFTNFAQYEGMEDLDKGAQNQAVGVDNNQQVISEQVSSDKFQFGQKNSNRPGSAQANFNKMLKGDNEDVKQSSNQDRVQQANEIKDQGNNAIMSVFKQVFNPKPAPEEGKAADGSAANSTP